MASTSERKIVCAVDASASAEAAFRWTLLNVVKPSDKLFLLHTRQAKYYDQYPSPDAAEYFGDTGAFLPETVLAALDKQATVEGAALIEKHMQIAASFHDQIACEGEVLRGDPRDKIVQQLTKLHADVLVVGSRGLGPIKRAFLGSVSDFCAHQSPCPIIIVREGVHGSPKASDAPTTATGARPRKVILAVDASDRSAYTFTWALANLLLPSDQLLIVTVTEYQPGQAPVVGFGAEMGFPGAYYVDPQTQAAMERSAKDVANALLNKYLKVASDHKIDAITKVMKGEPRERICEEAERVNADMLIMGCRGLGAIKRALLGSTSDYCAHHSPCPLVIVKTPDTINTSLLPEALQPEPKKET